MQTGEFLCERLRDTTADTSDDEWTEKSEVEQKEWRTHQGMKNRREWDWIKCQFRQPLRK